jgi:hypothetical protein
LLIGAGFASPPRGSTPEEASKRLDKRCRETSGFSLFDFRPQIYGPEVTVPILMAQLRRDFLVKREKDGEVFFDSLASSTKELLWIHQSNQPFYAYNQFDHHPERLTEWFDRTPAACRWHAELAKRIGALI